MTKTTTLDRPSTLPLRTSKWYITVEILQAPETSRGGIALPDEVRKAQETLSAVAKVVDLGPFANTAKTQSGMDYAKDKTNPKVGDFVFVGRYTGQDIRTKDGRLFKFINDYEVLGITEQPEEFIAYV
jgi:co-chaperonin GroES (HSP10)